MKTEGLSTEDLAEPNAVREDDRPAEHVDEVDTVGARDETGRHGEADRHSDVRDVGERPVAERPAAETPSDNIELFEHEKVEAFLDRWRSLQTAFVDDPREAVHDADQLVAEVIQTLATTFAEHKRNLETQWQQGESVATEDLRIALQRDHTFFNELLRT